MEKPGMVVSDANPRGLEAEAELQIQGQPGTHTKTLSQKQ